MNKQDDGGPAFPVPTVTLPNGVVFSAEGMSLRDWFAGQALPSVITRAVEGFSRVPKSLDEARQAVAEEAYAMADALLEVNKSKPV